MWEGLVQPRLYGHAQYMAELAGEGGGGAEGGQTAGGQRWGEAVAAAGPTAQVHPSIHSSDCTDRREGAQLVLPGGRDFGQKAEKGPRKHKVCRKEFVAEL